MLFRKKPPRSCTICLYAANLSEDRFLCSKRGVVGAEDACRKFRYDPCKRIPPCVKAPDFEKFKDEDFKLD